MASSSQRTNLNAFFFVLESSLNCGGWIKINNYSTLFRFNRSFHKMDREDQCNNAITNYYSSMAKLFRKPTPTIFLDIFYTSFF